MNSITVVATVYNEEKKIADCLASAKKLSNDIIIVDQGSTDKTLEIVKKFTSQIFYQENDISKIDLQKNFGFLKAKGDWIFSIDADELITDDLCGEIQKIIKLNPKENAFQMPRKNIIFNKWIKHTGWYPDYQIRLFRKGKARFIDKYVHSKISVDGEIGNLINPLIHNHYTSVSEFINKMNLIYAPSEANKLIENGYKLSPVDAIRFPFNEFLSRYFLREGYKDGLHGFVLSVMMGFYHFMVFSILWEKENFREEKNFYAILINELNFLKKELYHWKKHISLNMFRNPLKKIIRKLIYNIK